ncbi:MAG: addiction module protein [Desulfobacteraceae bacterium]|nr:addiction module protein [Desulfobacteraceae bacterium]
MDIKNDNVIDKALSLPTEVRLELVDKLLASLNPPIDEEIEHLWAEEAEKRVSQIKEGRANLIHGDDMLANIRKKYEK